MAAKKANPTKGSAGKGKASARANATKKIAGRERSGATPKVQGSEQEISQSRFPGETPLTGEDRPADQPGGKKTGQRTAGRRPAK